VIEGRPPVLGMPVSDQDIESVYRLLLGRSPHPDEIAIWRTAQSMDSLRIATLRSDEFGALLCRVRNDLRDPIPARLPINLPEAVVESEVTPPQMETLLQRVSQTWTQLGRDRPHWSVLSSDYFLPDKIEQTRCDFYASGSEDVDLIHQVLRRHAKVAPKCPRVVEYGCGVGRVTPHLADAFGNVTAIDISTTHMELARHAVGRRTVDFRLARWPEFGMARPFDLWFSRLVLQHNPPPLIVLILRRAFELLAPGGMAVFQLPTFAAGYEFEVSRYLKHAPSEGTIEVHCLPQRTVFEVAAEAGCVPVEIREDMDMGPPNCWLSNTFVFAKPRLKMGSCP